MIDHTDVNFEPEPPGEVATDDFALMQLTR
jgi:hypothetical protein